MDIPLSQTFDGKKFMWDCVPYESEDQARETMATYEKDEFEVKMIRNENQFLVYSRRVAKLQAAE